jgi:membrane protein DedA with SNARE-associated domain
MLEWITNSISSLGYWGIILLMILENIFPPIPSEIIMPLAGFTVQQGRLNLLLVILAGTIGSVLGSLPWYYIGKKLGEQRLRRWIEKYGKWLTLSGADLDRSKSWFSRYGGTVVLFGRLIPGIRTYISVPAGLEEMSLFPYLLYSSMGTLVWVGLLSCAGFVLGQNYQLTSKFLAPISGVALISVFVGLALWLLRRQRNHTRRN